MDELLSAETKNFQSIMSESRRLKIPQYQRDYSWNEEQWEELWNDILKGKKNKNKHYMGAMVFISRRDNILEIVDGQQRLTTIAIIIHSVIKLINELVIRDIEKSENSERINIIRSYIGKKSSKDLIWENKLELNEENNKFYNTYIMNFEQSEQLPLKISSSNKLLLNCQNYFYNKILEYANIKDLTKITQNKLYKIMELVEYIVENLIFVKIVATSELSAYTIFETLNDRGIDLSITDLLKNYLLSLFGRKQEQKFAKNRWDGIVQKVELKNFPMFLRYYWMIENKALKKDELFRAIREKIKDRKTALEFLKELDKYADIFSALQDETSFYWNDKNNLKSIVCYLHILKVKQCYPLLMVTLSKMDRKYRANIFKACENVLFRYLTICGKNPNALEDVFNKICNKINNGEIKNYKSIKNELKNIYVKDEEFFNDFIIKSINTKGNQRIAKYILIKINTSLSADKIDININDNNLTLEHILPENPNEEWKKIFNEDEMAEYTYRLGNLTMLSQKRNQSIANAEFSNKIEVYEESDITLTKNIANYYRNKGWNIDSINNRQKYMGKIAKEIWKI